MGQHIHFRFHAILTFQPRLYNLKLQHTNDGQNRIAPPCICLVQNLHRPFCHQLMDSFEEFFLLADV